MPDTPITPIKYLLAAAFVFPLFQTPAQSPSAGAQSPTVAASAPPIPAFSLGTSSLALEGDARPGVFLSAVGRRAIAMGTEDGRFELWSWP